jgi:hypothetical protein
MIETPPGPAQDLVPISAKAGLQALPFHLDRTPVRSLRRWLAASGRRRC